MTGQRGYQETRKFRCQTSQPGALCKGEVPGTVVHIHPLPRGKEAIVCLTCGLSCILQKRKGGGRNLEEKKEGKLGGWSGEDEQYIV